MGNKDFTQKEILLNDYTFNNFNGNTSYLILADRNKIKIFNLKSNNKSPIIINKNTNISFIEMHPRIKTIFLSVLNDIIIIWEINQLTNQCAEKIIIKGHSKIIKKAVFCKTNDKLLASFSDDKTIKIWFFERHFCIANIQTVLNIFNIVLYYECIYYQNENKSITIYDINELKEVKTIKKKVDNFIIKDTKTIIIQFKNTLIFCSGGWEEKIAFDENINNMFYEDQLKILYLFKAKSLLIFEPIKKIIIKKFDFPIFQLVFLDNVVNSRDIFANFLYFNGGAFNICSFYSKDIYNKDKIVELSFPKKDFWKGCVSSISDIDALRWNENEDFLDVEILKKDYLNDVKIDAELINNYNIQLKDKKNQVKNIIKNYKEENDIEMNYFEYLKMLIKDNTNKDLIIKYLKFLEKNGENIKYAYKQGYQKEYNYYIIALTNEDLVKNNFKGNKISQRELFFQLLHKIYNLDLIMKKDSFRDEIMTKLKTMQIFNQPIDFNNEELYWYRNRIIIYFSLKKIFAKENMTKLLLMKNCIKKIFERKLLDINNTYIIKNKELLTSLIIFIAIPQDDLYCDFNLNLIQYKNNLIERNQEIINKYFKYNNNGYYELLESKNNKDKFILLQEIPTLCLDNLILNTNTDINLTKEDLKNYDELKNYFCQFLDVPKINKFLSKIYCSKVFKEAFEFLYPDYYKFPFNNEEEALKFIDDNSHYVPFKIMTSGAVTDKFTLEMYYFLKKREYFFNINNSLINRYKNLIIKILYISSFIKTNYHEINHEFYNFFFFHSNGKIPIETTRKKNSDEREGGKNLENLLFNNTLKRLTLAQSLYILNERNYNKSLSEFRKGFNETKIDDLIVDIDGIFSEFSELNDVLKKPDFDNIIKNIIIAGDNEDNDESFINNCFIEAEDEDDVLGFIRK